MTNPSKILLISRGFPPYIASLGGAIRILKLAEFFSSLGHETHVLAGRGRRYSEFGYGDFLRQLDVHYVDDPMLKLVVANEDATAANAGRDFSAIRWLKKKIKPAVLDIMVPDTGVVALARIRRAAGKLVKKHDITTIISSGPPHSDHLVAMYIKRRNPHLRWIVDYRDSWNGTALFRKKFWLFQWLNERLERKVLRNADHVTFISQPMIAKAARLAGLPSDSARFHLVMNGFDATMAQDPLAWSNDKGPLRIGYFGALDDQPDSYRNPKLFFETLLANDLPVIVELFGRIRIDKCWAERFGTRLRIHGNMSHAQALQQMETMDVLMLLHTRNEGADEVITGKIFEYLASGRPILSIGPSNMAVNEMLANDAEFHALLHDDPSSILSCLRDLIDDKRLGRLHPRKPSAISPYSRQSQYLKFLPLLQ